MRFSLRSLLLLLAIAVTPQSALLAQGAPGTETMLRPGDVLRLAVYRQEEFTGEFRILADSTLAHPLLGEVKVGGVPLRVAEQRLVTFLQRFDVNPRLSIEPLVQVAVSGQVGSPNLYTLPPEMTITQALISAGGISSSARADRVRLLRGGEELIVDATRPSVGLAAQPVQSGDVIVVDPKPTRVWSQVASGLGIGLQFISLILLATSR